MTTRAVSDVLGQIGNASAFAVRHKVAARTLGLEVKGVGPVSFPVSKAKALALIRAARPARHGHRDKTVLDPKVRDTWEIAPDKIVVEQPRWDETLLPVLERIARDLGLGSGCRLRARLHNLLVYEPGQYFVPHQDTEKGEGMIGTLVVTLPSQFTGGAIVIEHHQEKVTYRGSGADLGLIAFYADCHHEVQPVKSGYRVVLTYDLLLSKNSGATSVSAEDLVELESSVREFFGIRPEGAPDRLVYLLDHQYSQKGLAWTGLKGADTLRAAALRQVAQRLDCEVTLALADVHESWSCEDEYDHRYSRWDDDHDEGEDDEDADDGDEIPELIELIDSTVELRHFVGSTNAPRGASSAVTRDELVFTRPSVDLDPFQSEHEGYMGNWGNTVDHWYHRAAVVLWPRDRDFVIRAKTSARWAIGEIAKAVNRHRLEDARAMVAQVSPFWRRVARQEAGGSVLEKTLRVATALEDRELAAMLLVPFRVEQLSVKSAPVFVEFVARFGLRWVRATCASFATSERLYDGTDEKRRAWISGLPEIVRALIKEGAREAIPLARWIVGVQWAWVEAGCTEAARARPSAVLPELARYDGATLGLLEASLLCGDEDLHHRIVGSLTSGRFPVLALSRLLLTAKETGGRGAFRRMGLEPVREHAVRALSDELRTPARAADDWSVPSPRTCPCALCAELTRFLEDRTRTRLDWPLAEDKRAHVHRRLDEHELPVTHQTRRSGRPYTLVLEKTKALFERDTQRRTALRRALALLRGRV